MTRENKLGLLIGMAFVIVIGILISDHISSSNEPMGAPLRAAGDTLRAGLGETGNDDVAPVLRVPQAITPQQPVVINDELKHASQRRSEQPPVHFVTPPPRGQAITPDPSARPGQNQADAGVIDRIRQNAQQQGEDLVPAPNGPVANNEVQLPIAPPPPKPAARSYEAQPGDSLSTIALEAYGSSCRANREAIVAANPDLAANRDLIIAGQTYVIPALGSSAASASQLQQPPEKAASIANLIYTVKPHDTLWSIAVSEVGTPSAVAAIRDLNKDILNGSDRVRPNMKLTLPSKKTAE